MSFPMYSLFASLGLDLRFSCGVADIIANDQTLLNVEKTLKQVQSGKSPDMLRGSKMEFETRENEDLGSKARIHSGKLDIYPHTCRVG